MQCRDSDVFALESSIEDILNSGKWKNISEIEQALNSSEEKNYQSWLTRKRNMFTNEQAEELFYKDLMDRMCKLFPMKYKKNSEDSRVKYARSHYYIK